MFPRHLSIPPCPSLLIFLTDNFDLKQLFNVKLLVINASALETILFIIIQLNSLGKFRSFEKLKQNKKQTIQHKASINKTNKKTRN